MWHHHHLRFHSRQHELRGDSRGVPLILVNQDSGQDGQERLVWRWCLDLCTMTILACVLRCALFVDVATFDGNILMLLILVINPRPWTLGTNCPAGCCPEANWFCCPGASRLHHHYAIYALWFVVNQPFLKEMLKHCNYNHFWRSHLYSASDFQWCAAVAEECPESKKLFELYWEGNWQLSIKLLILFCLH